MFAAVDFVSGFVFTSAKTEEQRQEIYEWFAQKVQFEPPPEEELPGPPLEPEEGESDMSGFKNWDRVAKAYAFRASEQEGTLWPDSEENLEGNTALIGINAGDEVVLRLTGEMDSERTDIEYTRTGEDTLDVDNDLRLKIDLYRSEGGTQYVNESTLNVFSRASFDDVNDTGDGIAAAERVVCNSELAESSLDNIGTSENLDCLSFLRSIFDYGNAFSYTAYQIFLTRHIQFVEVANLTTPSTGVPVLGAGAAENPITYQIFDQVRPVHTGDVTVINVETQTAIESGVTEINWGLVLGGQTRRIVFEIQNNEWAPLLIDDVVTPSGVNIHYVPAEIAPGGKGYVVLEVDSSEPDGVTGGTTSFVFKTFQDTAEESTETIEFSLSGDVQPVPSPPGPPEPALVCRFF